MSNLNNLDRGRANITIVIPVKDRVQSLSSAIDSICSQTVLPREVIIVDDDSSIPVTSADFTSCPEIDIRIIRISPNVGGAAACNQGVREAKTDIVAFLDSDDCFSEKYVEKIDLLWSNVAVDVACIYTGLLWCTDKMRPYRVQSFSGEVTRSTLLNRGNIVGGTSVLSVNRSKFLEAGGFPCLRGAYDWAFMLKITSQWKMMAVADPLVFYRSPSTSSHANLSNDYRMQSHSIKKLIRSQPPGDQIPLQKFRHALTCQIAAYRGLDKRFVTVWLSYVIRYGFNRGALQYMLAAMAGRSVYETELRRYAELRSLFFPLRSKTIG